MREFRDIDLIGLVVTAVEAADAPPSTQLFLLVGAAVLIPVILAYTGHAYWVFRGKVTSESGYY
jgi:cytochrome d ubiquinol oxidase subunit II